MANTKAAAATTAALAALHVGTKEQAVRMERAASDAAPEPRRGNGTKPALGPGTVRISLHLLPSTIREIKARAAEEGLTPSQVVAGLVEGSRK